MKRWIKSCNTSGIMSAEEISDSLKEKLDTINDDFDYLMSGIKKLGRSEANMSKEAEIIADNLAASIQGNIAEVAAKIQE